MHPAFLYLPGGRLTLSELTAARLDGHVVEIGEGYIPADLVEDSSTRAAAVAILVVPGTAASGPTAAWIHGAGDSPPSPHHIRRSVERRIRPNPHQRLVFHDTVAPPADLVRIGQVQVTTPLRTMTDLALGIHRDDQLARWAEMLADAAPWTVTEAARRIAGMSRVPGIRVGRDALEQIELRTR